MADGIAYGNRVSHFSTSKAHAMVVDAVLDAPTYWNRINGKGKKFSKPTQKYTLNVTRTNQGQAFKGLETLNSSASDTTIQLEFNHTGYTHPRVKIMLEHFANEGEGEDINLGDFIDERAVAEMRQDLASLVYGTGAGSNPLGLEAIIDDGTNASTIGGETRASYDALDSTVTASGGTLSLSKLATLYDTITSGIRIPNIMVTTPTIFSLYEQLLQPVVQASYTEVGYPKLSVRGDNASRDDSALRGAAGFNTLSYRGIPMITDEFATSGVLYMINEDFIEWRGRTVVPSDFKGKVMPVKLGKAKTLDLPYEKPSDYHGWFVQEEQMMPNQAGLIGRYYVIGQVCTKHPGVHGKLTGISSV